MIEDPVKYVLVLIGVFATVHLLVEQFEKATELPEWLTPRLGAMLATFMVALLWLLKSLSPAPPY